MVIVDQKSVLADRLETIMVEKYRLVKLVVVEEELVLKESESNKIKKKERERERIMIYTTPKEYVYEVYFIRVRIIYMIYVIKLYNYM